METLIKDLRWTSRTMRRHPIVTLVVILTLGLAIGANTAVFSVVNAFLLRPLPVTDIDRVVRVREDAGAPGDESNPTSLSSPTFFQWQRHSPVFEDLAAGTGVDLNLTGSGEPERLSGARVTWNLFQLLGIDPLVGRHIKPDEDRPGAAGVVLLGHSFWQRRFASSWTILGQTITLDGLPHTIIGVMPPKLRYPYDADVWVPLQLVADAADGWYLNAVARLTPEISVDQAEKEMTALVSLLSEEEPRSGAPRSASLTPFREEITSGLDQLLALLSAAAVFVLLIACVNVANLLLAQSLELHTEVGVRLALGASRKSLMRQFLTYSVVLALISGAVGLVLSLGAVRPLMSLTTVEALRQFDIEPRVTSVIFAFMFLVSLLVGVFFGLLPALGVSGVRLQTVLKEGGRSGTLGLGGRRVLSGFVVAEVALALVLLVAFGLVFQSFQRLLREDRGFEPRGVLSFEVTFPLSRYPELHHKASFIRQVTERLQKLPGVTSAATTTTQPLDPGQSYAAFNVEGKPATNPQGYHLTHTRNISPGYFDVMKIPLRRGRFFMDGDDAGSPPVVIVSDSFAEHHWPGEDPIGKRVKRGLYDMDRPWIQVVGVVGTLRESEGDESTHDAWYMPYGQPTAVAFDSTVFVLRAEGDPRALIPVVRQAVWDVDPDQPIFDIATMEERLAELTQQQRSSAALYGFLSLLGLILAALGIYGILSFSVRQRTREIGIRSAMGALPKELRRLILRKALGLTGMGLALGVAAAIAVARLMANRLEAIEPHDVKTLIASLVGVAVVALASSYVPARRAAFVDPVKALRNP